MAEPASKKADMVWERGDHPQGVFNAATRDERKNSRQELNIHSQASLDTLKQ